MITYCVLWRLRLSWVLNVPSEQNLRETQETTSTSNAANINSKEVTRIVKRNIIPGCESEFDSWVRRVISVLRDVPGYRRITVIVPNDAPSTRYIVLQFADAASMDAWENSEKRHRLVEEADKYSRPLYEKASGLETWFTLPNLKAIVPPPRWKMAIVTFLGAYTISAVANLLLKPIIQSWPVLASGFVITTILVLGLTYFVMPSLTRVLRRWLHPTASKN